MVIYSSWLDDWHLFFLSGHLELNKQPNVYFNRTGLRKLSSCTHLSPVSTVTNAKQQQALFVRFLSSTDIAAGNAAQFLVHVSVLAGRL